MVSGAIGSDLQPYASLREALSGIPANTSFHHPSLATIPEQRPFIYDPDKYVLGCITTSGSAQRHWTGRSWTIRELAMIQGFPITYHFCGKQGDVITQIGNAIPPIVWKHFVQQIMTTLDDWKNGKFNAFDQHKDIAKVLALKTSETTITEAESSKHYQDKDLDLWITDEFWI
jgi:hypothetical protein